MLSNRGNVCRNFIIIGKLKSKHYRLTFLIVNFTKDKNKENQNENPEGPRSNFLINFVTTRLDKKMSETFLDVIGTNLKIAIDAGAFLKIQIF